MSSTETVDPRYVDIDVWPTVKAIEAMLEGQESAVAAIKGEESRIAAACDEAAQRLLRGGRLCYAGAGTSGRLAVQDGVELGPTFGWPDERLAFVIAGGMKAVMKSVEGAEDDAEAAQREVAALNLTAEDVLIGVAASGRTRFTVAAVKEARRAGALTIAIANNRGSPLADAAEHPIVAVTGSEVIAGSTRMKAGTAQKVILNLLSTGTMLRCGRVYRGLMVDMIISNAKLQSRAEGMVAQLTGCEQRVAADAVRAAKGDIKKAVLVAMGVDAAKADKALAGSDGNLRRAIESLE